MRTIKFRGKSIATGNWSYGHYIEGSPNYHYITNPNGDVIQVNPETIGQFTGLKGKNGVEIYEGDILQYTEHKHYLMETCTMFICWDYEMAGFGYKIGTPHDFFRSFWNHDELQRDVLNHCEVTGNIHEK